MTEQSIAHAHQQVLSSTPVQKFMTAPAVTVVSTSSVRLTTQILLNKKVTGLPVVDELNRLVGIVSENDLLLQVASGKLSDPLTYTRSPEFISPETTLKDALIKMFTHHRKWLPVADSMQRVVGIIARRDLLQVMIDNQA